MLEYRWPRFRTLSLVWILLCGISYATPQIKDKLVYKDETVDLIECGSQFRWLQGFFLEQYFEQGFPKPSKRLGYGSTACTRGYVATWEIKNQKLYLKKIETEPWRGQGDPISLTNIFPNATNNVFAFWVKDAQIKIPQGYKLPFSHDGSASDHEIDLYVNLTNGVIESTQEVHNLGKKALLSVEHMKWMSAANNPIEDIETYLWDDIREVATLKYYRKEIRSKYPLRTRGFLQVNDNKNTNLYVGKTRLTPFVSFCLHNIPDDFKATNGIPVEIKATFTNQQKYTEELNVTSIRYLKPGEAVNHPRYKLPLQEISPTWGDTLFEQ